MGEANVGPSPLIAVKDLVKSYDGTSVLKGLSFSIEEGDLVSIIGPSGCGKSTLLRCLNCLEILYSVSISIAVVTLERAGKHVRPNGDFYAKAHQLRAEVGMVLQSLNLFPHKTVRENVMLAPMVVKKENKDVAEANALRLLEIVGLGDRMTHYPRQLSGGQEQRVAIARALVIDPDLILADEPTGDLDAHAAEEILKVLQKLNQEFRKTVIMVTHDPKAATYATVTRHLDKGEMMPL